MRFLIGVDDTDDLESRGTGHCIRQMAEAVQQAGLARPEGITRHQLLVSPEIPYTSHNSSACLAAGCEESQMRALWEFCADFLRRESAPGSDVGLCLAAWDAVSAAARDFGRRAKVEVLTRAEAEVVARRAHLRLAGLTGTGLGVIGALAAAGLRADGNDGRFLWLPGLRELNIYTVAQLQQLAHVDSVCTLEGIMLSSEMRVEIGDWVRPVLRNGQAILLVEEKTKNVWRILPKEAVKDQSK
jgi:hypothetical protein